MSRVYRLKDRIDIELSGGLVVTISPLSVAQKAEVAALAMKGQALDAAQKAIKYAVKDITGVEDEDGAYKLQLENGVLTDDCVEDLMNMDGGDTLQALCIGLLNGVKTALPEGVKILEKKSKAKR
jgi:hypothetical protein